MYYSLGLVPTLLAALLSQYPMTLELLTYWILQRNPGFVFTVSQKGLSGSLTLSELPHIARLQFFSLTTEEDSTTLLCEYPS